MAEPIRVQAAVLLVYTCCECKNTALVVHEPDERFQEIPAGWKQLYEYIEANEKTEITDDYMCGYCRVRQEEE